MNSRKAMAANSVPHATSPTTSASDQAHTHETRAMPRLRFCFVLSSLRLSGGVRLVIEYANRLCGRGHTVHLITPGGTVDPALRQSLDPHITLRESRVPMPARPHPLALMRLVAALAREIPRVDLLIATHTPTVASTLLAARLGRKGRRAWLYMDYDEMFRTRPVERFLLHNAPHWFEQIWTISRPLQQQLAQQTRTPVWMTGGGLLNADLLFERPRPPRGDDAFRVLYVGDDRPRKGLREFLRAMERVAENLPHVTPIIVSKHECTVETTLPYEFHLFPSHAELADLYSRSDLFVSSSWGEGLGYPPLEAMACGTPVVLTDSAGVLDYARDGENCLLAPPRDVNALARAAVRVLTDADLAAHLAQNGVATAKQYRWETVIDRVEAAASHLFAGTEPPSVR